ncbi:hypothetical protein GCM10020220_099480 [Nonomuraea rubra]
MVYGGTASGQEVGWVAGAGCGVAKSTPAAASALHTTMRAPKISFVTLGEKLLTFRYHSTY